MTYQFSGLNWYNMMNGQEPEAFHIVRRKLPVPVRFALRWSGYLFSDILAIPAILAVPAFSFQSKYQFCQK